MKITVIPYKEPRKSERTWKPRSVISLLGRKSITIGRSKCGIGAMTVA